MADGLGHVVEEILHELGEDSGHHDEHGEEDEEHDEHDEDHHHDDDDQVGYDFYML